MNPYVFIDSLIFNTLGFVLSFVLVASMIGLFTKSARYD